MIEIEWEEGEGEPHVLRVYVDKSYWKNIHKLLLFKYLDQIKRCKTKMEVEEKWLQIEQKAARDQAIRLLALKGRFSEEIRQKLTSKGYSPKAVEAAVDACSRLGYLNDEEEGRRLIQREKRRGYGPAIIHYKLKARGCPSSFFEKMDPNDQIAEIAALLRTRYRHRLLSDPKEKQKVILSLQRRGFDLSSILSVLKNDYRGKTVW